MSTIPLSARGPQHLSEGPTSRSKERMLPHSRTLQDTVLARGALAYPWSPKNEEHGREKRDPIGHWGKIGPFCHVHGQTNGFLESADLYQVEIRPHFSM